MALNPNPPAKPWLVVTMARAKDAAAFYPWHIEVENHYYTPDDPNFLCHWQTKLDDPRFDLSRARGV